MRPINIAYFIKEFIDGGAERQILELIRRIDRSRYKPIVCTAIEWGPIAEELHREHIKIFVIPKLCKLDPLFLIRLSRLFKTEKVDLVHTYCFDSNVWGILAAKLANVPIIISSRRDANCNEPTLQVLINKSVAYLSDKIIVNTQAAKNILAEKYGINSEKIFVIYNGVDLGKFNKANIDFKRLKWALLIGMVARFSPEKDYETFLRAAKLVLNRIPNAIFLCVGVGPLKSKMEVFAREIGISGNVIYTGLRRDIPAIMAALDIFVLSSIWEGMPNVILEAMAARKPVVTTAVGGCKELVIDGKTGFVVPPRDPQSLSKAIVRFLTDKHLARQMGFAGYERVKKHFSLTVCIKKTQDVYNELIKSKLIGF